MIRSLLIANRGEIARRIIATAKRLGVRTVAVYSEADAGMPFVLEADAAVLIGPAPAQESYLVAEKLLAAAAATGAEAIHPGYGFLSENPAFAQAVIDSGRIWVGPKPHAIRAMGLKDSAKKLMAEAGVAVTPGYLGEDQSAKRLAKEAKAVGYPVLIKAVAGGGGKGMRKVEAPADFESMLASCQREAAASFGDDRVLLEKYVTRPRHIEVQIFGDSHGNIVHLFERDCSLQRRHQKVIEEAPAPGMDEATREAVCSAAVRAAQAVQYENAGTIEFIADASEGLRADRIWFMEMNTRLQVEHPVTEMITGLDLVEWQLRVAAGEPLPKRQEDIAVNGHAMEARLYAENPAAGFLPSTGPLKQFLFARDSGADIRVDAAVYAGNVISPHYDPMIAKLIAHGTTRMEAIDRLKMTAARIQVWPVKSNAGFLVRCLELEAFRRGDVETGLIAAQGDVLTGAPPPSDQAVSAAAQTFAVQASRVRAGTSPSADGARSPWSQPSGLRLNAWPCRVVRMRTGGLAVEGEPAKTRLLGWEPQGERVVLVTENGETHVFELDEGVSGSEMDAGRDGAVRSPMPGRIVSVSLKVGDNVSKGQPLLTLTAMKMEHVLIAPLDGVVVELAAAAGDQTVEGAVLVRIGDPAAS